MEVLFMKSLIIQLLKKLMPRFLEWITKINIKITLNITLNIQVDYRLVEAMAFLVITVLK